MSSASLYPHLGLAVKRFAACLALGLALAPVWGQGNPLASLKGSIVYIREGNIWAFTPSTGERRQLTQDGGYRSPSMADDGTIGAVQGIAGRSHFVTIRPDGRKRAFPPGERIHLVHAELSPDGDLFAFAYVVMTPLGPNPTRVGLTFSDRWAAAGVAGGSWGVFRSSYHHARWMTGERLILSGGGSYPYLVRGAKSGWEGESSPYRFEVPALRDETYDIARNGARFLVIGATYRVVGYEEQITGWHAIAYRPARSEEQAVYEFSLEEMRACRGDSTARFGGGKCVPGWIPEGGFPLQGEPKGGAIAPDGRAMAFADARGLLVTGPIGPSMRAFVVDPKGSEPEWSPFPR